MLFKKKSTKKIIIELHRSKAEKLESFKENNKNDMINLSKKHKDLHSSNNKKFKIIQSK